MLRKGAGLKKYCPNAGPGDLGEFLEKEAGGFSQNSENAK